MLKLMQCCRVAHVQHLVLCTSPGSSLSVDQLARMRGEQTNLKLAALGVCHHSALLLITPSQLVQKQGCHRSITVSASFTSQDLSLQLAWAPSSSHD